MYHTSNYDAKVKTILDATKPGERVCRISGETWDLTDEEIDWCRRFHVPPSEVHPIVRLKMLLAHNTDLTLWWKPHAVTGEPILTFVHPDNRVKIVRDKEWVSLENTDFGRDANVDLPFFEQLDSLYVETPFRALSESGDSTNTIGMAAFKCTDSFMIFGCVGIERSSYIYGSSFVSDSVDVTASFGGITDGYHVNHSRSLHQCFVALESHDCLNSAFLFDCRNCEFCFGATNQRNKKYLWFNEPLTKEEWERRRANVDLSVKQTFDEYHERFIELVQESVWPSDFNLGELESSGEYLEKTVRAQESYQLQQSTDCYRCWYGINLTNAAYYTGGGFSSDLWQSSGSIHSQNIKFCHGSTACQNLEYCLGCLNCEDCFGCIGLQRKKFCILNKPYTEEEYWRVLDRLKCAMLDRGEYGRAMPARINPLGAQFSAGSLLIEYAKDEIKQWGGELFDDTRGIMYLPEVSGSSSIMDRELGRPFLMTETERAFYTKHQLPEPTEHFLTRLKKLVRFSNGPLTESARCDSCQQPIVVHKNMTFNVRRVYCPACYQTYLEANS
jgi:hypothetical protein